MKNVLENVLAEDTKEHFKVQIHANHLECEEAAVVADSHTCVLS